MTANPILLQKKYSRVIECFAKQQGLSLDAALDFFYHLFTECAYAQSFLIITGRAADIIISVVAKCHVHHACLLYTSC